MAIKAVNNTAGPNRLVPILLVYRAYPRISNLDPPALSITDRAAIIQKAIAEIVKLQAKQIINSALHHYNRPNTTLIYNLPLNSKVLIWRKSSNQTRPYYLLTIEGETCRVQLPNRPTSFRSTSIKPYFQSETSKTTYNADLDKLKAPLLTLKVSQKSIKPIKPIIKRG